MHCAHYNPYAQAQKATLDGLPFTTFDQQTKVATDNTLVFEEYTKTAVRVRAQCVMDTSTVVHGFEGPSSGITKYRPCNTELVSMVTTPVIYSSTLHGIHGYEGRIHGYRFCTTWI